MDVRVRHNDAGPLITKRMEVEDEEFLSDFTDSPYQTGSSLNAAGIYYGLLRMENAMKRLTVLEALKTR